jgi:hypothetical protein
MTSFHGRRPSALALAVDFIEKRTHHPKSRRANRFKFGMECLDGGRSARRRKSGDRAYVLDRPLNGSRPAGNNRHGQLRDGGCRKYRRMNDVADLAWRCRRGRVVMMQELKGRGRKEKSNQGETDNSLLFNTHELGKGNHSFRREGTRQKIQNLDAWTCPASRPIIAAVLKLNNWQI